MTAKHTRHQASRLSTNHSIHHVTTVNVITTQIIPGRLDDRLEEFIGQNGAVMLLSFLDVGPYLEADYQGPRVEDMREFVEFMRRLNINGQFFSG
jgi:hypothetical protein